MELGNFKLRVVGGVEASDGYVDMQHEKIYSVYLYNGHGCRADGELCIDGTTIGTYRIRPFSGITIEHSGGAGEPGRKFTFYALGSQGGNQAGLVASSDLGLVQVTFHLEKQDVITAPLPIRPLETPFRTSNLEMFGSSGMKMCKDLNKRGGRAGGTGQSEPSDQVFRTAGSIEYDLGSTVVISLRLRLAEVIEPELPVIPLPGKYPVISNSVPKSLC